MAQTAPLPVESYGRLPAVIGARISPDGERVAVAVSGDGVTGFQIVNLQTGQTEHNYQTPSAISLRGVGWGDNDHALMIVSGARSYFVRSAGERAVEFSSVVVFDRTNGRQRDLEVASSLISPIEGQPGVGYALGRDETRRLIVYRVNLENGAARQVDTAAREAVDVVIDNNGTIVARVDSDEQTNRWDLYSLIGGQERQLLGEVSDTGEPIGLAGLLPDGRLVVSGRLNNDVRGRVYAVDMTTGERAVLSEHERYDVEGVILDPASHLVVGVSWVEDLPTQRFFDAQLQTVYDRVNTIFADGYATLSSWSADRSRFIVRAERADDAGAYYMFEPATGNLRSVARNYRDLVGARHVGDRRAITYPARDGTRIPAYLTLPDGQDRNLPLVLLVHGGPHARDVFTFDWWASFLASRGYAVLQPNYRGSTGYGHAWFDAGRGGWGDGVMQTDVEDGVVALIRSGVVDPARVCIVGASYGGYAALAGATITPDRYRCAVSVAGVSDPGRMVRETVRFAGGRAGISDWWRLSIGDPRADAAHLRQIAPVNLAERVRVPVLLIHGDDDSVVPLQQSQRMAEALRAAGKPHQLVVLDGDDHWLSAAATRTQMLREIETFLARELRTGDVQVDPDNTIPSRQ
jgi:dipeptidyl aminopeptidase/acylaminoacyl peptidase